MGLDAHVCCDCFEQGRLKSAPPPGCKLSVTSDGSLLCGSDDLEIQLAFDRWQLFDACEHESGRLVSHRIGNIALVSTLREELSRSSERFRCILSSVIHNGTHCGDFIPASEIPELGAEVESLAEMHCLDPQVDGFVKAFASQMSDLIAAANEVNKPIVF
jgi:hypothetical protein